MNRMRQAGEILRELARTPDERLGISRKFGVDILPATREVTIHWGTGAAPSVGRWEEGELIVEIAKQQDLARKISDLLEAATVARASRMEVEF